MGIYIDYSFYAKCSEKELLDRLRRLRRKVARLPLNRVGRILRLDPAYQSMPLDLLRQQGCQLPAAVKARLKGKKMSWEYRAQCGMAVPPASLLVAKKLERRFMGPAIRFLNTTELWNEADLPEKVAIGSITYFRRGFPYALAEVMLRYGYLLMLDPGKGSERVHIGLTTFRQKGVPMWLGSGFTKTQYAERFTTAHENVCHILDAAREAGLLLRATDTCGFYRHRSWKKAAPLVNRETTFAHVIGQMLSAGVAGAQAAGMPIEDISDPATKNYNLIHVDDEAESE